MSASDRRHRLDDALAGRYVIEREIGRGGMATVYLARDLRHERLVAVKVLAPELGAALGPERFLAEIHVTAALQHPNLLPLFDSGSDGDELWYVMPYVEGESLRARLERERQLPIDRAVHIATAVASALDYAHRHGVIHRDLKPENILLHDGEPLVADFGIALAVSRTPTARITQTGFSLGTPQYMSPEQASGERTIDGRSDVYALACVLYEMLTGEPPFGGSSSQAVIARIMTERAPSVRAGRPSVPAAVDAAVARALEKIPADRFETAHEFAEALNQRTATLPIVDASNARDGRDARASITVPAAASTDRTRSRHRDPVVLGLATVAILSLAGLAWMTAHAAARAESTVVRFVANEPGEVVRSVAISPDGHTIAYNVGTPMTAHLALRSIGELHAHALAGTDQALNPFFSPDGRWIAFLTADDRLEKVAVEGGDPVVVSPAWRFGHGSWAPDGRIVFTADAGILFTVPAGGGTPQMLTPLDTAAGEAGASFPFVLRDGTAVIYAVRRRGASRTRSTELAIVPLSHAGALAPHRLLGVHGTQPLGVIDGWLLYVSADDASIMAIRFDAGRGSVSGDPVMVLHEIGGRLGSVSLAMDGTLAYTPAADNGQGGELVLADLRGTVVPLDTTRGLPSTIPGGMYFRVSPDGRRLAFMAPALDGRWAIWLHDFASGTSSRLTGSVDAIQPEWMPDGARVIFLTSQGNGAFALTAQRTDGSSNPEVVAPLPRGSVYQEAVAPDGRVVVQATDSTGRSRLWFLGGGSNQPARLLTHGVGNEAMPRVSPDGHLLAYTSDETGAKEVYVTPFPGPGGHVQVSENGGVEPMWAPDGRRLFYRRGTEMWEATVAGPGPVVASRHILFQSPLSGGMPHADYAVMPDGAHFVAQLPRSVPLGAVVVVNWITELRARLASASH